MSEQAKTTAFPARASVVRVKYYIFATSDFDEDQHWTVAEHDNYKEAFAHAYKLQSETKSAISYYIITDLGGKHGCILGNQG